LRRDLDRHSGRAGAPSAGQGAVFLVVAVLAWGLTWPINKAVLEAMSPYWMAAFRSAIAAAALACFFLPRGRLVVPSKADMPVLVSITLLHMVGFSVLAAIGLQLVPVGRSVVLAYTTPLWVMPGAALFLGERFTFRRVLGLALGLAGLGVLFNPFAFDWHDRASLLGHGALLAAAFCWAASILHIRGHAWRSTPLQLLPWETFLATAILFGIALVSGPWPEVEWNAKLLALLAATSVLGSTIPYWAVAMAGRGLPAGTVSLGLLGAPVVGVVAAMAALGEIPDPSVWIALAFVIGGVAFGTTGKSGIQNIRP
jgi:drug/metabolite transporter (DMT)-like permease